ncbi:MAG: putative KAP-like P-loop ATPase, partial [Pirellulaceae bacterium]
AKDLIVPKIDQFFEAESERLQFADLLRDASETAGNGKPVIVLIDELDRCRPNYSVDLLERLKHYFAVEGIVFVLAVDKTQLCHAINGVYGEKFDSSTYLPRFFDEIFRLAKPDGAKYTKYCLTALDNSVAGGLLAGWFC